jgi:hypothetical protein
LLRGLLKGGEGWVGLELGILSWFFSIFKGVGIQLSQALHAVDLVCSSSLVQRRRLIWLVVVEHILLRLIE